MALSPTLDYAARFRTFVTLATETASRRLRDAPAQQATESLQLAIHRLSFALTLPDSWPSTRGLLLELAPRLERAGYPEGSDAVLIRSLERCQTHKDAATEAELCGHLGALYQRRGQLPDARAQLERAWHYYSAHPEPHCLARTLNCLAQVAHREGQLEEAVQLAHQALALADSDPSIGSVSHMLLGSVAFDRWEWEAAEGAFRQSLALWQASGDQRVVAFGLVNLGTALRAQQRPEEAIPYYEEAIRVFAGVGDLFHQAVARMNLGNVQLARNPEAAIGLYELARAPLEQMGDRVRLAQLYNNIGMAYQSLGQWSHAERSFRASLEHWQHVGKVGAQVNVLDNLGTLYMDQGEPAEAVAIFRTALGLLEQIEQDGMYHNLHKMVADHLAEVES